MVQKCDRITGFKSGSGGNGDGEGSNVVQSDECDTDIGDNDSFEPFKVSPGQG